jgi:hypothetical protein
VRGTGEGVYAEAIAQLFEQTAQKLGFEAGRPADGAESTFQRPPRSKRQLSLF